MNTLRRIREVVAAVMLAAIIAACLAVPSAVRDHQAASAQLRAHVGTLLIAEKGSDGQETHG